MSDYSKLKVTELKEVLKQRGIPSTGLTRKQQIVEALEKQDAAKPDTAKAEPVADIVDEEEEHDAIAVSTPAQEEQAPPDPDSKGEVNGDHAHEEQGRKGDINGEIEPLQIANASQPVQAPSEPSDAQPVGDAQLPESAVLASEQPAPHEPEGRVTPQIASPKQEAPSSDNRKRKRRSPTPPPKAESINKKLKAAEESVQLPEDIVVEDAPAPVNGTSSQTAKIEPHSTSDEVMDVQKASNHDDQDQAIPKDESEGPNNEPSLNTPTRAIYIRDLVRPLQPQQLRTHLVHLATPSSSAPDDSIIGTFHLDAIRTHAFATFTSLTAATRARNSLHNTIWPDEPARKPLWVDFVPEASVPDWIDTELSAGTGRRDAKRWEVVYNTTSSQVETSLQELPPSGPPAPGDMRHPSIHGVGQGMPNAPSGPRANRQFLPSVDMPPADISNREPSATPVVGAAPQSASFNELDQRFPSTTAKPKLYFLPVSQEIAEQRLAELDRLKSRDWDGRGGRGGFEGEMRRYTFEEGGRVVDGGRDIGSFDRGGIGGGGRGRGRW